MPHWHEEERFNWYHFEDDDYVKIS